MGSKPRKDSALPDSVTEAAAEIERSIDAADRTVSAIRADIEAQDDDGVTRGNGDQLTTERMREITELTDSLIEQVQQVRRRSQALLVSLDQASHRIGELTDDVAPGSDEPAIDAALSGSMRVLVPGPPPAEPVATETDAVTGLPTSNRGGGEPVGSHGAATSRNAENLPDEIMIRATQLAVAGGERQDIANALQAEFGVEDAEQVIDQIMGPEHSSDGA